MYSSNTPILFLNYNRPELAKKVLNVIRKIRPKKLYISVDGPKNEIDAINVSRVIEIVKDVDWNCSV